jgi:hypothetical protein
VWFGQYVGQAGNIGGIALHLRAGLRAHRTGQFIAVAGQCEQRRMCAMVRCELVPRPATEAHREQAIRWDTDAPQGAGEGAGIVRQLRIGRGGEAQFGTRAAGDGSEHARPGMAMEGMATGADSEAVQRRGVAVLQVHAAEPCRRLVQRVDEGRVVALALAGVGNQRIAGANAELCDQRDFGRTATPLCGKLYAWKRTAVAGRTRHRHAPWQEGSAGRGLAAGTGFALERATDWTDFGRPGKQRVGQAVRHLPEVHELAALFALDQPGFLKDAQVAGQRGLAEVEALGQLTRTEFTGAEIGQDLAAGSGGEGFEDAVHGEAIS